MKGYSNLSKDELIRLVVNRDKEVNYLCQYMKTVGVKIPSNNVNGDFDVDENLINIHELVLVSSIPQLSNIVDKYHRLLDIPWQGEDGAVAVADDEIVFYQGQTPLHVAAAKGLYDVVKLLIDKGCNMKACDCYGWNALLYAAANNTTPDICKLLLQYDADVNCRDNNLSTVLHVVVSVDVCSLLANDYGADVNAIASNHATPLHIACCIGSKDLAILFISYGCDIYCKDSKGNVAIDSYGMHRPKSVEECEAMGVSEDEMMTDDVIAEHKGIIIDAYTRESNWRRRKYYMMFAHGMMKHDYSNSSTASIDTNMLKVYTIFSMRNIHEHVVSYI